MLGAKFSTSLTAWQIAGVAHETAVSAPTEEGTVSEDQVVPALTVPMMTGLPKMPKPTAVQSDDETQEMPFRPATPEGSDCGLQARPALTDARTELTPTAKQSAVVGHEAALRRLVPGGGLCAVPRQAARRRGHDGGPGPKVARVADGDTVFGGRAGDPGEFDGVARWGLERPGFATVGCLDYVRGRAEVGTDGDAGCCEGTGDGVQLCPGRDRGRCSRTASHPTWLSAVAPPPLATPTAMQVVPEQQEMLASEVTEGWSKRRPSSSIVVVPTIDGLLVHSSDSDARDGIGT